MQKKISKQLINEQYDFVCFELDIAKDVTANTKEVGGNTYNQSIAWVEDVKKDCQKRGKSYEILID